MITIREGCEGGELNFIGFFVKFGGNLFFISTVFFFLNPKPSHRHCQSWQIEQLASIKPTGVVHLVDYCCLIFDNADAKVTGCENANCGDVKA